MTTVLTIAGLTLRDMEMVRVGDPGKVLDLP